MLNCVFTKKSKSDIFFPSAFEYGSTYEYHGQYSSKGDDEIKENSDQNEISDQSTSQLPELDDLDELLQGLSEQELRELSVIDPDVNKILQIHSGLEFFEKFRISERYRYLIW